MQRVILDPVGPSSAYQQHQHALNLLKQQDEPLTHLFSTYQADGSATTAWWTGMQGQAVPKSSLSAAQQQALEAGVDEVIQFRDGFLTEGASCNIWIVRDGTLLAPMRNNLILEGIRYSLMEELAAQAGIAFQARQISREEVDSADEIMMTAATKEVLPIVVFNGQPVGDGRPGPVFAKLREGYDKAIKAAEQA